MDDYYKQLPKKRLAAGGLIFNESSELLVVKPSYQDHWSIPGGVVESDESPREACIREISEEIGILLLTVTFLCVDYVPADKTQDENLQFIFYGGMLNRHEIQHIHVDGKEIITYQFLPVEQAISLLSKHLSKRVSQCATALKSNKAYYLEAGESI